MKKSNPIGWEAFGMDSEHVFLRLQSETRGTVPASCSGRAENYQTEMMKPKEKLRSGGDNKIQDFHELH